MKLLRTSGFIFTVLFLVVLAACGGDPATQGNKLNVAFLPKAVNNPYFDTAAKGGQTAANELNGSFKQVGPSEASAAEQVPYITTLTEQGVSAIVVSGNDPNALAPSLKQAISKGIKVVSYDSDVATDARQIFINQADSKAIAVVQVQMLAKQIDYKGEFAILSAASTATNQNAWIQFMQDELKKSEYAGMKLVKIAYGNDDDAKSYNEALSLMQAYPDLKGIISPTTVGIAAAARAVESVNKSGKVIVTGLGTPNQMRAYVKSGTSPQFALWDPGQLGYLAYYAANALVKGEITGKEGESFNAGKLGLKKVGANGVVLLGDPTVFTKDNIDQFNF